MKEKREEIFNMINHYKIIAILRKLPMDAYLDVAGALYRGGIRLLEVPFDQSGELTVTMIKEQIHAISVTYPDAAVGAGTVITKKQVDVAREAGATYIISPNADREIIEYTKACGLISMPGAITPTEIQNAYQWGADFVKLFPAGVFGTNYLKDVAAPLSHIKFLAVGGIDVNNMKDFLKAGCKGVGIGSSLVDKKMIKEGRYDDLMKLAREYVDKIDE